MFNTQLFIFFVYRYYNLLTLSTIAANPTVLSSTTDKINRISNHFWDRWRHECVVNLRETQRISKLYKNREKYPDTFGEFPITGVLPSRDSEIRGAIM